MAPWMTKPVRRVSVMLSIVSWRTQRGMDRDGERGVRSAGMKGLSLSLSLVRECGGRVRVCACVRVCVDYLARGHGLHFAQGADVVERLHRRAAHLPGTERNGMEWAGRRAVERCSCLGWLVRVGTHPGQAAEREAADDEGEREEVGVVRLALAQLARVHGAHRDVLRTAQSVSGVDRC